MYPVQWELQAAIQKSPKTKLIFKLFFELRLVFPGYLEKKRSAAKYPWLYGPQGMRVRA